MTQKSYFPFSKFRTVADFGSEGRTHQFLVDRAKMFLTASSTVPTKFCHICHLHREKTQNVFPKRAH